MHCVEWGRESNFFEFLFLKKKFKYFSNEEIKKNNKTKITIYKKYINIFFYHNKKRQKNDE